MDLPLIILFVTPKHTLKSFAGSFVLKKDDSVI